MTWPKITIYPSNRPPSAGVSLRWPFSIFIIVFNNSAIVLGAGFFAKCVAVVAGSALGWGGAMIGDAIRRFAHPDAVFTSGGILQLVWIKIFWALGPQVIGLLIGSLVGVSLMLK